MADPDAPRRGHEVAGPWLHWIRTGFTGNEIDRGTTLGIPLLFLLQRKMNFSLSFIRS